MSAEHMERQAWQGKGLYFIPLGGSEEFGVNLNLYACNGSLLAVDCGLGFADERFPGIDLLLPDPYLLESYQNLIEGLIITHAHEDHIGAVAYLWERFECQLYASPFTANVLRKKLDEMGLKHAKIDIIQPHDTLELEEFRVTFLPVSHSVPDACALVIDTAYGEVMHSGDWNLDPSPVLGFKTEAETFQELGKRDILAYIGDSTNANVAGYSGSERDVEKGLEAEFAKCEGRIAITIFSSNISRIQSIARAAQKCGRDVGVIGRSLHRMISCARESGYLDDIPEFISEEDLGYLPNDRVVMILTGSQGEYRAALAKIARGDHPNITLNKGDTVIFSARPIPGNERNINNVKNNLIAGGVNIVTPRDTDHCIHVSGHPCQDEIAEMLSWVKPGTVIPVHGERLQLESHARFAEQCQIAHTVIPRNGSVIQIAPGKPVIVDHIETGLLAVDQKRIIPSDHQSISARRKLQYTGALHMTLVMDSKGKIIGEAKIDTMGLIDEEDGADGKAFLRALHHEVMDIIDDMNWEERLDDHFIGEEMRIGLRRYIYHALGFKPKANIHVVRI